MWEQLQLKLSAGDRGTQAEGGRLNVSIELRRSFHHGGRSERDYDDDDDYDGGNLVLENDI